MELNSATIGGGGGQHLLFGEILLTSLLRLSVSRLHRVLWSGECTIGRYLYDGWETNGPSCGWVVFKIVCIIVSK